MKSNGKNNRKNDIALNVQKAKQEQAAAEKAAEQQAMFIDFWETMTENEYIKYVQMINLNQISITSKLFNKDLLQFFKMKREQENEQIAEESQKFFDLLPQMSESVQKSMIEFINDHFTDEQTHCEYVSLVKMARERAVIEHEIVEKAAEEKAKFLIFWESLDESKKDLCITGMHSGYIAGFARKFVIENFKSENNFNMLLQNQIFIEKDLIVVSEEQAELERQERVGDLMEENLRNEELEEEENDRLEKEFFKGYAQETEIEKVTTEILTQTLTINQTTEIMKTPEVVNEVATENTTVNNTQNIVNQQVTNNTLNVTVETPKPKMSIADKIIEAHKMLVIAAKKEITEAKLKEFHGYLHANKDGDNFTLMSLDKAYNFSTNNAELVKEVNTVLERFLKAKIQEFENQLANFQI